MEKYFLLLKKQILCFAVILLIITKITVAMSGSEKCTNLKLNEKPTHMSVYEWCERIAELNVLSTFLPLCIKVGLTTDWKKYCAKPYESSGCTVIAMPQNIQSCVHDVFNFCGVVKILNPTSIRTEYGSSGSVKKIIVETETFGVIKVEVTSGISTSLREDPIGQTIVNGGKGGYSYTIRLSLREVKRLSLSDDSIEGLIGHELGHIICGSNLKKSVIIDIYEKNKNVLDLDFSKFLSDFCPFSRACEVQADVVGTFGNLKWVRGLKDIVKKLIPEAGIYQSGYRTHPTLKQRMIYLEEIEVELKKEKGEAEGVEMGGFFVPSKKREGVSRGMRLRRNFGVYGSAAALILSMFYLRCRSRNSRDCSYGGRKREDYDDYPDYDEEEVDCREQFSSWDFDTSYEVMPTIKMSVRPTASILPASNFESYQLSQPIFRSFLGDVLRRSRFSRVATGFLKLARRIRF